MARSDDDPLRIVSDLKLKWRLPEDPVAQRLLIPALRRAETFDCMVGYFGEGALRELAPGLASFVADETAPMRLLISPVLSADVRAALELGNELTPQDIQRQIGTNLDSEAALGDALTHQTLQCLAYLLAAGRLQIKIVILQQGIFHLKEWILTAGEDIVLLSGSANFTGSAISRNVESLFLHRSWRDEDNYFACHEAADEFNRYWEGEKEFARIYDMPEAIKAKVITEYRGSMPPVELIADPVGSECDEQGAATVSSGDSTFGIPAYLNLFSGPYRHQGEAIDSWEANGRRGILALATGAGKTITALAAAARLADEGPLLIVIAVPTNPLVSQWREECGAFNLSPLILGDIQKGKRPQAVSALIDDLEWGSVAVGCIIVTNEGLLAPELQDCLAATNVKQLLVADEVHNLGGNRAFRSAPPSFSYRLGLSATPIRQYDDEGTSQLVDYFDGVVFEFGLEDAIGVCLVPYDYYIHTVSLTVDELESYVELSEKIRKAFVRLGGEDGRGDTYLTVLLNKRRLILETAFHKIERLESLLDVEPAKVNRTLIYATDKDPSQLQAVNSLLSQRRIRFHQVTDAETTSGRIVSRVLAAFSDGILQVLTAKRVLDEGLNVPQIDKAYILASTTVRKQWIQRRGRVLRPSPATGKDHAVIHDFVVVPPAEYSSDPDARKLMQGELDRCQEFARLARNRASSGGPYEVINNIGYQFLS